MSENIEPDMLDRIAKLESELAEAKQEIERVSDLATLTTNMQSEAINAAVARADNEHEAFLSVHRDNMRALDRNMTKDALVSRMREALKFYSIHSNYNYHVKHEPYGDSSMNPALLDGGQKAREALALSESAAEPPTSRVVDAPEGEK